jgi:riboflavin synthase
MFTGLVEEMGTVAALAPDEGGGARITIRCARVLDDLATGDSVSVSGACLTATEVSVEGFSADCAPETLRRTAIGGLRPGDRVNLERPPRAGDRMGGHLVQGHVDAVGTVRGARPEGQSLVLEVAAPAPLLRYVVEKGSVAVDGISLTVAARLPDGFTVALIPETVARTTLGPDAVGRPVNLEVDVVAKYVESLTAPHAPEGNP